MMAQAAAQKKAEDVQTGISIEVGVRISPNHQLPAGTVMRYGNWTISANQEFVLIMQGDGNLILYRVIGRPPLGNHGSFNGEAVWSTGTVSDRKGEFFAFQYPDGNLVVYGAGSIARWTANTHALPGHAIALEVSDAGKLVLYKAEGAKKVWST